MKNIIVLIIVLTLGIANLNSQEEINEKQVGINKSEKGFPIIQIPNYYFGIHNGLSLSNVTGESSNPQIKFNNDYNTNYNIGVSIEINNLIKNPKLSLESRIFYIGKGRNVSNLIYLDLNGIPLNDTTSVQSIYHYLQIPFMLNYNLVKLKKSEIDISGGAFVSYLLSLERVYKDYEIDIDDKVENKIDLGINVGLSYKYLIRDKSFIGLSYNFQYGFNEPTTTYDRNLSHIINLFYKFY